MPPAVMSGSSAVGAARQRLEIRIEVAEIGVMIRDDDRLGGDARALRDPEELVGQATVIRREHREMCADAALRPPRVA